jgi:hypothetical protein
MSTVATAQTKLWAGGKSPFNVEYGKVMMWYFLMSDTLLLLHFLLLMEQFVFLQIAGPILMKFSIVSFCSGRCTHAFSVCKYYDLYTNY